MNNQSLVIYEFDIMYDILKEIESHLNFKLINISKNNLKDFNLTNNQDHLIISQKNIKGQSNQIIIDKLPIEITKLIESININLSLIHI